MVDSEFELFDRMNEEWKKKYYTYLYLNQHFGHEHVSFLCLIYLPLMKYFSKVVIDVLFRKICSFPMSQIVILPNMPF